MERRALIIYCDKTASGALNGPDVDNENYRGYLRSNLGGDWVDEEIKSLHNPTVSEVKSAIENHLKGADYAFIIFTGHGCTNSTDDLQYIELMDDDMPISEFKKSNVLKQTIIIDACRTYALLNLTKAFGLVEENLSTYGKSTRALFDKAVSVSDIGTTIMYAAGKGAAAYTSKEGGLYLRHLVKIANAWKENNKHDNVLSVLEAHNLTKKFLWEYTDSSQIPEISEEKRKIYFPFAVKFTALYS